MNKSTEINTLPQSENQMQSDSSNDLVNNIINEIKSNEEGGVQMDINEQPPQTQQQMPPATPPMYNQQIPPHLDPANDGVPFNLDNVYPDQVPLNVESTSDDMISRIMNKLKNPLVVFIILFIMLLPVLDKYLSKVLPNLYVNNNNLSIIGVFVKSIIGTLLFYLSTLL